jgi:hypothetical protein
MSRERRAIPIRPAVDDGAVPDLVLSDPERLWVHACGQAATANHKEVWR